MIFYIVNYCVAGTTGAVTVVVDPFVGTTDACIPFVVGTVVVSVDVCDVLSSVGAEHNPK
jgi:hypothetical protein